MASLLKNVRQILNSTYPLHPVETLYHSISKTHFLFHPFHKLLRNSFHAHKSNGWHFITMSCFNERIAVHENPDDCHGTSVHTKVAPGRNARGFAVCVHFERFLTRKALN